MVDTADIEIDAAHNRALVLDRRLRAIIAMDLSTGERSVLSDNAPPNTGIPISASFSLALDAPRNRVLLVENAAVVAVDLNTGARSVLSDNTTPDTDVPFSLLYGIAVDAEHNRALVTDPILESVIAVDLSTGVRSVLSDNTTPNTENPIVPQDIALDPENNRALVINSYRWSTTSIMAIDLTNGTRSQVSYGCMQGTANPLYDATDLVLDPENGIAYVTDNLLDAVVAVYLKRGERVILSK